MDIKTKTEVELKALMFDEISQIEMHQKNLQILNDELIKRKNIVNTEPVLTEDK